MAGLGQRHNLGLITPYIHTCIYMLYTYTYAIYTSIYTYVYVHITVYFYI